MAKPIRSTPTLKGQEAIRFLREFIKEEKHPSKARIKILKDVEKLETYFSKFIK